MRCGIFSLTTQTNMSAVSSSRSRKVDPLSKKIPSNPKYKDVKATVDTGASLSKYMAKLEDIRQNYKYRKDEIFKRMKLTTFVQLICQVYKVNYEQAYDGIPSTPGGGVPEDQELQGMGDGGSPVPSLAVTEGDYGAKSEMETSRSTLRSVARGVGELDLNQPPPPPCNTFVDDTSPYLLLDVREQDEYDFCHIVSAKNYPKAILSRSVNYESKEMLGYKNMPGKIIVVYDEDERIAPSVATTLVQRGYDNIFMLSGGLKVADKLFPEGLITGTVPQCISGRKTKQILPAEQRQFTQDDIDCIEIYLDNALQDHSTGSRLSKASTASSRISTKSSMSTRSCASDRPPFK